MIHPPSLVAPLQYMQAVYIVELSATALLTGFLIFYYSDRKAPLYAKALVFTGILCSLLCFALLPIDIYESSLPRSQHLPQVQAAWTAIYYVNFFLCWLVLPLAQEYEDSGEFSRGRRVKESLVMNGILMGVICLGAIGIVVYLLATGKFSLIQLPSIFATLVNVFGLTLVSILLGFGLISFPKECFLRRDHKRLVTFCHRQAEAIKAEQQTILEEVWSVKKELDRVADNRDAAEKRIVLTLIAENFKLNGVLGDEDGDRQGKKSTADLHKIIKKRILQKQAMESQLDELVDDLQSTTLAHQSNGYRYRHIYYTLLFLITSTLSGLIFFAELATFAKFLSPANVLAVLMGNGSGGVALLANTLLTAYVGYIVTHTIFRVRVYKVFALHRGHSSASSLLFTAINLARVSYPLCYNYLQITGLPPAAFLGFFGEVTLSPEIMVIFPILMLAFAGFNLCSLYDKIMGYLGLSSYAFDEEQAEEKKQEGRQILIERFRQRNPQAQMEMIQLL